MTYAFRQMCTHHSFEKMVTARIYENVKKDIIVSRETIEKRSQANTGKKRTQEQCARISEAKKKNMTNEARKKIGNGRRGAKASKETLQKMREATTERWKNPEYAEKQSQLHKGHKHSEEQRKRIGDSNRGKKRSEEACKNIRVPHPRMKGKGAKKIECIELKRIFSSLTEAQNWLKSQNLGAGIYNSLINAKLRTGGYHWRYVDEQV